MLRILTLVYILFLAIIVLGANLGILQPFSFWLHNVPFGDKTCHFVFVGLLCFFVSASLGLHLNKRRKRTVILATIASLAMICSLEELSQSFLTYRQFSELDMLANLAGIFIFGCVALLLPARPVQT